MASPPAAAPSSSPPPPPSAPAPSNATSPPPLTPSPSSPPPGTSPPSSPPPQDAPLSSPSPPSPSGTAPSSSPPAPPAPKTPSAKSPPSPTTSLGKSSPPPPRSTSPSPPDSGSNSIALYAGVAVAAGVILLILSLLFLCCKKKRRRRTNQWDYHGAQPPVPSVKDDYPGDPYGGAHPQGWQNMVPPPPDNIVKIYPPSPPPSVASRPPQPPPPSVASRPPQPPPPSVASRPPQPPPPSVASRPPQPPPPSVASRPSQPPPPLPPVISVTSGSSVYSEPRRPPPPPGIALGFSKCSFTYEELLNATDGFSISNLLGQGGFGYVHKGILGDGEKVAVKQLKSGSVQGEREFQAEVDIISRVHHKHLVSMIGYCISGDQRLLVYEFIPNNTLEFHLHGKGRSTMDWPTRLRIALGSAKGLAYLHEDCHPRIIHRDIKASNILLDFKFEPKVADFGLAKLSADNNSHVSTRVMGTFGYLAPEYASSGKLTEKSDVFSFGVVLLELITGRRPVDVSQTYMDDSLVDWARPLLTRALEEGNFEALVDPKLHRDYNNSEMARMVACAASAVRHSAKRRPQMGQIVRALEGVIPLDALNEGVIPGHSSFYGSHGSSDYEAGQYGEQMRKLRKMAFANSGNYGSSVQSMPTSEYGLNTSGSSSEGQPTREFEMTKTVKKGYGL